MRSAWLRGLLDLLYPSRACCAACGAKLHREDDALVCRACNDALLLIPSDAPCPRCGEPHAARGCTLCFMDNASSIDSVIAAFPHLDTARSLVHALKYHKQRHAALPLVEGMTMVLFHRHTDWDVLVPIPLHPRRLRERGFNQAFVLADELGKRYGIPAKEMLRRTVDTAQQAHLDAAARLANVQGAFASLTSMQGLRVLLVDDVRTTGATAEAAAGACKDAGALRVGLLTATCAV